MVRAMPAPIRLMVFDGYQPGYGFYNAFGVLTRPLLQKGSKGPAVVELQTLLEQKLQQSIGVDGDFGPRTYNAVLDFQRMSRIAVDGIVGKDTWSALLGQPVQVGSGGGTTPPPPGPGTPPPAPPVNDGDLIIGGGGGGGGAPAGSSSKLLLALVGVTAAYFIFKK